jgi:hypothetical protein
MKKETIITPELARIHAHLCGDGFVSLFKTGEKDRNLRATIGYSNNNQKLLEEFRRDFNKIFNVKMTIRNKKDVYVRSIKIYLFIINKFGSFKSKKWRIPKLIKDSNKGIKLEWLKSFFEDEAYDEKRYNRLKIKSVNLEGLEDIKDMLDSINIFSKITGPNCDETFYITIPHFDSVKEFQNFVKIPARKTSNILNSYSKL